ncbi:MAG: hypothetical protein Q8S44_05125 [Flavobacteriaceae bacterium]|nr:hypothetical protein [Flavobacteriaceae bacterium]
MTSDKNLSDKLTTQFDLSQLKKINFGKLEGERDPMLEECFFPTNSVQKYLNEPINYVLSPKGAGKSALFRTIEKKYLHKSIFDYEKFSVISINEAFGFDDEYLNVDDFKEKSRMKLTISWGVFLISKLVNDIKTNFSDKHNYNSFISEVSKIDGFKEKFNLYDLNDLLNTLNASINFTANGQEFEVKPSIKLKKRNKKLVLNDLFKRINDFYKSHNIKALILIDRIDNFVQKEKYSLQKKYIQGLFDCIEEISLLENIHPTLFLRTDLFYSYDSDIEVDKIKDRTIELNWIKGETLNFLLYRFNDNPYIKNTFNPFLLHFMKNEKGVQVKKPKKIPYIIRKIKSIFNKEINEHILKDKQAYNYRVSEKYLTMFFPKEIEIFEGEPVKFVDWLFIYLKDANDFVNPRLLIDFFNQLIDFEILHLEQYCFEDENRNFIEPSVDTDNNIYYKNLFHQNSYASTYKKIQNDSLKTILVLVKTKDFQTLFKEINTISYFKGTFKYGDINMNKFDMPKDTLDNLLKYLKLLGFCKEIDKQKYVIPPIYKKKLDIL